MAKKLYLMSGHSSSGRLADLDRMALADADNGNVLVLNLSGNNEENMREKRVFLREYFEKIGVDDVSFVEYGDREEWVDRKFEGAGLVYLPGGDTSALIDNIKRKGLDSKLRSFSGVISGNSAGTYALCPDYLRIGRGDIGVVPSLELVDFWTKVHYESKFDSDLLRLSESREIYGLENESAIVVDDGLDFVGNIWRFSRGEKERVN